MLSSFIIFLGNFWAVASAASSSIQRIVLLLLRLPEHASDEVGMSPWSARELAINGWPGPVNPSDSSPVSPLTKLSSNVASSRVTVSLIIDMLANTTLEDVKDIDNDFPPEVNSERYVCQGQVGKGGFGHVLAFEDSKRLGTIIAVKIGAADSLRNERKILALLAIEDTQRKQRIVHMVDSFTLTNQHGISTACISFPLLRSSVFDMQLAAGSGPLHPVSVQYLVFQIANALKFCERIGVVHADVKPENMLLTTNTVYRAQNKTRLVHVDVKLADFGCSFSSMWPEKPHPTAGTMSMLAPERLLEHESGPKGDVWSLGLCMLEWAVGLHFLSPLNTAENCDELLSVIQCITKQPLPGYMLEAALERSKSVPPSRRPSRAAKFSPPANPPQVCHGYDRLLPYQELHNRHIISLGRKMIQIDPQGRVDISRVLKSPWFANMQD